MGQQTHEAPNGQQIAYYTPTSLTLRQVAGALSEAGQALDGAGRALLKLANDTPEPAPSETAPLRGAELRRVLVEIGAQVSDDAWPIHYRDWFAMVERAGYRVGGRDPLATFVTQLGRAPEVEGIGNRSGLYRLAEVEA